MSTEIAELPAATKTVLYSVTDETIERLAKEYMPLTVNGLNDRKGLASVKKARMEVVRARTAVEKTRKELKSDYLEAGRKVDSEAKRLTGLLEPIETHLLEQENAVENELQRIEQEKQDAIYAERLLKLNEVGGALPEVAIRSMTKEQFDAEVARAAELMRLRKIAAEKEAADEAERQRLHAEESERNRVEAERLAAERAEFDRRRKEQEAADKAERERLDAIRRQEEEAAAKKRAEEQAALDKQRAEQQAEIDRLRAAQEEVNRKEQERLDLIRKTQEAAQAKIDAETMRLAAERKAKEDAELLEIERQKSAEQARIDTERRLAEEADAARVKAAADEAARLRAEALRPDRDKLFEFGVKVSKLEIPTISDDQAGRDVHQKIRDVLSKAGVAIKAISQTFE